MLIIGCDFHSRSQQIARLDTETGELIEKRLEHENGEAKRFYEELREPALVGIETTGYTRWFAEMLAELGHELVVGEAGKIRAKDPRKQKHDRRDAALILDLLVRGDFPRVWLPPPEERDVRVLIEPRHQWVELRTRAKNGLQAMALSYGLRRRARLWSERGQEELQKLPLREGMGRRREDLLRLLAQLNAWVKELDQRIAAEVARREDAQRLMTHPGVGPLTALATVLVLGPVERFPDSRHLTSYLGLIPQEESSGPRQRFGHLTKQGNRLMRFLLVEAAGIASRFDPGLRRTYRRLAFRKGAAFVKQKCRGQADPKGLCPPRPEYEDPMTWPTHLRGRRSPPALGAPPPLRAGEFLHGERKASALQLAAQSVLMFGRSQRTWLSGTTGGGALLMNPRTKVLLLVLLAGGLSLGGVYAQAQKKPAIAFPLGFRKWTHVKSVVIFSKENKLFNQFAGLHNIYVNDIGWPAFKVGLAFPDGSMFAFELCDTRTYQGAIECRGRKFLAVMKKNAKLYPETGGWGFEVFQGYQGTGSLKDMKECWSCHSAQKHRNYVFSEYME